MLTIWIVTEYHEYGCDNVLGVYLTEAAAKRAYPGDWSPYNHTGTVQGNHEYRLFSRTLKKTGLDPLQKLALDILTGDPMALDLARDVLRC